jgi:uncharacterized ubiquitin-like protein YukD
MSRLFGNPQTSGSGSIFGGGSKPGGLFGTSSTTRPTGGMFGGAPTGASSSGGIFGSSNPSQGQPQSTGGGIFGSSSGSSGGMFGGGTTSTGFGGGSSSVFGGGSSSTGMFGSGGGMSNSPVRMGTTSGGLFGAKPSASSSGGIFGSKPTTSTGGGLFGASKPATGGGIFGSSTSLSQAKSSFFGGGGAGSSTTGMFSQSSGGGSFGAGPQANWEDGTAAIHFAGIKDKDHGGDSKSLITLNAITAEPSYCMISLEELRFADYILKTQGKVNFPIGAQPGQQKSSGFGGGSSFGGGSFGMSSGSKPATGTMFGSGLGAQSKPAGGLFGGGSSASTSSMGGTGLFGSSAASKPSGTGLFGGPPKQEGVGMLSRTTTSSSLFGGAKPSGGLFGSSAPATSGFGAKPSVFGGSTASTGSSLFGGSAPAKPSLFGGSSGGGSTLFGGGGGTAGFAKPAFGSGGSTFGATQSTSAFGQSSGAFGGSSLQQPQAPNYDQTYLQAFAELSQDPYGLKGLEDAFQIKNIDADKQVVLNNIADQILKYTNRSHDKDSRINCSYDSEFARHDNLLSTMPIKLKLNRRELEDEDDYYESSSKREIIMRRGTASHFDYNRKQLEKWNDQERRNRIIEYERAKNSEDEFSHYSNQRKSLAELTIQSTHKTQITDKNLSGTEQKSWGLANTLNKVDDDNALVGPNVIKVKVFVFVGDTEEALLIPIDKTRKVKDLKTVCIQKLKGKYPEMESSIIKIVHKSRILNEENTLVDSGVENGMKFDVLVQEEMSSISITKGRPGQTAETSTPGASSSQLIDSELIKGLVPIEKLPKMARPNYRLTPSIIELARMNEYQLMNIKDLCIENQFGKILWEGRTDVRGIDFDQLVSIERFVATVYPEDVERKGEKPPVGQGLNKPAIIDLFNISLPARCSEENKRKFVEKLKAKTESMSDSEFISYSEATETLKFKVPHFSSISN